MSQAQIDNLIEQFTQSREQANQANRQRYQELLNTIGQLEQETQGLYGQAFETVAGLGDAERRRIQEQQQKQLAATEQDLINRGLGSTTIRQTARRGIQSDAAEARQSLMERLAQQRTGLLQNQAGALMQTGQMEAQAIEGRTDQGPAASRYAQMVQQLAAQPDQGKDETFVGRGLPQTPVGGAGGPAPGAAGAGSGIGTGGGGGMGDFDPFGDGGGTGGGGGGTGVYQVHGTGSSQQADAFTKLQAGKFKTQDEYKRKQEQLAKQQKQQSSPRRAPWAGGVGGDYG